MPDRDSAGRQRARWSNDCFGILTALWEAVRRRPVPMRAREIATYFGFAVLALLMVVAFRNDIARLLFC